MSVFVRLSDTATRSVWLQVQLIRLVAAIKARYGPTTRTTVCINAKRPWSGLDATWCIQQLSAGLINDAGSSSISRRRRRSADWTVCGLWSTNWRRQNIRYNNPSGICRFSPNGKQWETMKMYGITMNISNITMEFPVYPMWFLWFSSTLATWLL